jgi:hypothetical protein
MIFPEIGSKTTSVREVGKKRHVCGNNTWNPLCKYRTEWIKLWYNKTSVIMWRAPVYELGLNQPENGGKFTVSAHIVVFTFYLHGNQF